MKNEFSPKAQGIMRPDFYHGAVIKDNGTFKIEWNDPRTGRELLTEQDLRDREASSRESLSQTRAGGAEWEYQRNVNYSAEYGLEKLQRHKMAHNKALDTPLRPVIPN